MSDGSGIQVTTLDNGLRVVTDSMTGVETVSLGVWVGVGTRDEAPEVNGVAHLVEHMLFKGTPKRDAYQISQQIEDVGGHLNAYTTREHTAYYGKVLKEDAGLALDIVADMVQHASLDADELAKERTVVLQEIGQAEDTPDDIIFDHFQATAFPGQALGRPVLGLPEIVERLSRDDLNAYVQGHYSGPAMVVAASGRIEHARMVDMAAGMFGALPEHRDWTHEKASYRGGDFRDERDLEQTHVVLGFEAVGVHHEDNYATQVLSTLLGGGMSSRLFQEVREKRGLVYSIYSFASHFAEAGLFGIYAGTGPEQVAELVPVVCGEVANLVGSIREDEVARARAQLKSSLVMALESSMARCEQVGQQMLIHGRPIPVAEMLARVNAVDVDAVERCARRLLESEPVVTALGPLAGLESYDRIRARLGH
ncbi:MULTISPECIES: M16 family metallopeptidase [Nitrospirillum]|uniref:Putative Zn-dependent peptidase n=1 Tax=Nitrospirillum amazonense TaxID=28077 RepID=A0A560FZ07_9PROT|nr:pitrilysin family protein [Nitrospirillum amazonense]MEC4592450.1 pitrilysin family protein [Nitrospirillum amazonense]TWB26873.1 putative Zn-dependent peptidase [Nitrospirillum amazonense]